jgi:3-oxoacyl-[acyl-carrier protein] reductase
MIDPKLDNRVVLITGANHGIGAAMATAFAAQGANVFITYYRGVCKYSEAELRNAVQAHIGGDVLYRALQQMPADLLVAQIQAAGGVAQAHEVDLANHDNIPVLFDLCQESLGSVDVLVNNHTYCVLETFDPARVSDQGSGIHLISSQGIDAHLAINTRAYALLMAEYLRRYLKRQATWGRIINISTDAAHAHTANVSYAASKHAIESYSRSAASEMGKYGITVNIIAPGPIQTGYITPENEAKWAKEASMQRIGQPEDVADVAVFLASDQARWLTGQLLYVGGGSRIHQ